MSPIEVLYIQKYINNNSKKLTIKEDGEWDSTTHQAFTTFQMYAGLQHWKLLPKTYKDIQHAGMKRFVELCLSNVNSTVGDGLTDNSAETENTQEQELTSTPPPQGIKRYATEEEIKARIAALTKHNTAPPKPIIVPSKPTTSPIVITNKSSNDKLKSKNLGLLNKLYK